MGFAAGVNAGTALVSRALENERLQRAEGRTQKTFEDAQADRAAQDKAIGELQTPWGLNPTSPVTPVPNAPPASVAATGGEGVAPTPPAGLQLAHDAGLQGPPAAAAPAAAGLEGPPAAAAPAAPAAGLQGPGNAPAAAPAAAAPAPEMSPEKKFAAGMFNIAKAKRDVKGMNEAVEQYHTAARKDIVNDAGKMDDAEAYDYVHNNVTRVGGMPMSVVKEGKDGYRVMAWSDKSDGPQANALLSSSDMKKLVAADKMMKLGYAAEGLELAGSVDKQLNAVIKEYNAGNKDMATVSNTVAHNRITAAETERNHRASEANSARATNISAGHLKIAQDKAKEDKAGNYVAAKVSDDGKSVFMVDKKNPERTKTVTVPEGFTANEYLRVLTGEKPESTEVKMGQNGGYIRGDTVYTPNPNFGKAGAPHADKEFTETKLGGGATGWRAAAAADIAGTKVKPGTAAAAPAPAAAPAAPAAPAAAPTPQLGLPAPSARPLVQGQGGPDAFNQQLQARRQQQVAAQEAVRSDPEVAQLYQQYSQASGRNAAMARSQLEQLIRQRYSVSLSEAGL